MVDENIAVFVRVAFTIRTQDRPDLKGAGVGNPDDMRSDLGGGRVRKRSEGTEAFVVVEVVVGRYLDESLFPTLHVLEGVIDEQCDCADC